MYLNFWCVLSKKKPSSFSYKTQHCLPQITSPNFLRGRRSKRYLFEQYMFFEETVFVTPSFFPQKLNVPNRFCVDAKNTTTEVTSFSDIRVKSTYRCNTVQIVANKAHLIFPQEKGKHCPFDQFLLKVWTGYFAH